MTTESSTIELSTKLSTAAAAPSFTARLVLDRLARIETGSFTIVEGGRRHVYGNGDPAFPPALVEVRDERFFGSIAHRGTVGAGESYALGWWTTDDLTAVVRAIARNEAALSGVETGMARLSRPILAIFHAFRRNTEKGSRANIAAHYDLSNEFFELFLDDTMMYSCGVFERPGATLREASVAKIDRICKKLELKAGDHLLEIGTGWGGFAIHAARTYGCRVTTTTISRAQHDLAAQRIRDAGLEGRITLLFEDYRRLSGTYDKLVSIEMIEAVGHRYYDDYFARCSKLLKPGGRMCIQAITIADQLYENAKRSVDFIQRYIFPGSCIPSVTALCTSMTKASELRLVGLDDIGTHYVETLMKWRDNLILRADDARKLGFTDEFLRLWDFYFCYCAGGFAERRIGTVHMLLERPASRFLVG
ncbi:MAG: cyclopropane-fatty-acyl-phospholipid synthase family protein [Planctomycetota bacterium]|nr:cyclopropane-fatty-acyl-phospholipid synthase family protein [Planctomycetota bacterium]